MADDDDDVRRWSVTYTKHIKQKRKVYQDGFLHLYSSTHKVKLYDDCEKLLDSKIVKLDDDAVRSGETLTLGSYLVDIGDLHGENKSIPNPILQRDKTKADGDVTLNSKTRKRGLHNSRTSSTNLSPSRKMIREFKRHEVNKYSSSPSVQETNKADSTEWEVLYTTQLTQKAKKYHDGIMRVAISGLHGRQAVLYDETRNLLGSKFLRKDEVITAGGSVRFNGHLVDIVELKDNKPVKDTSVDRSNYCTQNTDDKHLADLRKREATKSSVTAGCAYTTKTDFKEWDVMYTSQVTQKAKKYHDGVLKLASSGSQGRQEATLLADDGLVLSHRYLKLSEDIRSGSSFNMTSYLVEVGEPRKHPEGTCPKKVSTSENEISEIRTIDVDKINLCKRIPATGPLSDEKSTKRALSLQDTDSKVRNSIVDNAMSTTVSQNKPLRDAHSILAFLKKPSTQEGVRLEKVHVEEIHSSKDSAFVQSGILYQLEGHQKSDSRSDEASCNEETLAVDVGGHLEVMPSKVTSTSTVNEPAKETNDQSDSQISCDNMKIDSSVCDVSTDTRKGFMDTNLINDDFPSFDLGFD